MIFAIERAQRDEIALVAGDIHQLVLPQHSAQRGKRLAFFFADLDRHREKVAISESETDECVRDAVCLAERLDDEPRRIELAQIERLVVPRRRPLRRRLVAKIADMVDRQIRSVECRVRKN